MSAAVIARLDERDMLWFVDVAAKKHGVTRELLCGRGRSKHEAAARHDAWRSLHAKEGLTIHAIAVIFGVCHTTVLAAINPIRAANAKARGKVRWLATKGSAA